MTNPEGPGLERRLAFAADLLLLCAGVALLVLVLWVEDRGLDLTDESFYLLAARTPEDIVSVTNFGHYVGVLYAVAQGNVGWFRRLGTLVLLAVALGLVVALGPHLRRETDTPRSWVLPAALGTFGVLGFYSNHWIPSPGYQWLTLVGTLAGCAGVALALGPAPRARPAGAVLYGAAGVLVFVSKPPSAVVLACLGGALLVARAWQWRRGAAEAGEPASGNPVRLALLAAAGVGAACSVHALAFDSPSAWYRELTVGYELLETLGYSEVASGTVSEILGALAAPLLQTPVWWGVAPLVVGLVCHRVPQPPRWLAPFALGALLVDQVLRGDWTTVQGVAALNLTAAAFVLRAIWQRAVEGASWGELLGGALPGSLLCGGVVVAGSFSGAGLVWSSGWAVAFFAVGGACLLCRADAALLRVWAYGFALGITLSLVAVLESPYRLTRSIWEQDQPGSGRLASLWLEAPTRDYLDQLTRAAEAAGLEQGTLVIDLTGDSPGAVYALGGEFVGSAWLVGGVSGSRECARRTLSLATPEELAGAWYLLAPGGSRAISSEVLSDCGLDFPADYQAVVEVSSPRLGELQILYRPRAR